MYTPQHFSVCESASLFRMIEAYPLGVLVTSHEGQLDANHIPFELDRSAGPFGQLSAHVARANPVWQQCMGGADVLVIFRGQESYVSPNWYPSKHETHRQVPTWNYEVVHAHGRLTVRDDERFLRGVLARLTRVHEADEPRPWKMGDSAPEYIDMMIKAVVGIEIAITRLEGKSKLSQNREPRDIQNAAQMLRGRGKLELAGAMENPPTKSA